MSTIVLKENEITKADLAKLLGLSTRQINRLVVAGYFKPVRQHAGFPTIYSLPQIKAAIRKHRMKISTDAYAALNL